MKRLIYSVPISPSQFGNNPGATSLISQESNSQNMKFRKFLARGNFFQYSPEILSLVPSYASGTEEERIHWRKLVQPPIQLRQPAFTFRVLLAPFSNLSLTWNHPPTSFLPDALLKLTCSSGYHLDVTSELDISTLCLYFSHSSQALATHTL